MPSFAYNAIDQNGARAVGNVVAPDQVTALDMIVAKGLTPLEVSQSGHAEPWWNRDIALFGNATLKPVELEKFFSALSAMLAAKTPLPRALRFCMDMTTDKRMKNTLRSTIASVEDGMPLADALLAGEAPFPDRLTTMIELGEASNTLELVVNRAAKLLEKEAQLRNQVQQALIYPIILLCMSVFVLSVLVFYLAPTLAPVFASANEPPPKIISIMLWTRQTLVTDWPLIFVGLAALTVLFYAAGTYVRTLLQWLLQWLPGVRRFASKHETLMLCQTMYFMLSSGGQLTDAISTAAKTTRQQSWRSMLTKAHKDIEAGHSMSDALLQDPRIDPMARTILKTGEESDQLVAVLEPTIATLQTQTSQILSQTVKLLTPILTLVIGLAVGAIILSTISAIMDLNDVVL